MKRLTRQIESQEIFPQARTSPIPASWSTGRLQRSPDGQKRKKSFNWEGNAPRRKQAKPAGGLANKNARNPGQKTHLARPSETGRLDSPSLQNQQVQKATTATFSRCRCAARTRKVAGKRFFLKPVPNPLKRFHKPMALLGATGLAGVTTLGIGMAQPAQAAATVSGQAINASSLLGNPSVPPTAPFLGNVNAGETFEINLSDVLSNPTTPGDFNLDNIFSLQFANLNTGSGLPTVSLSDLQLEVTGQFNSTLISSFAPVALWDTAIGGTPGGGAFIYGPQTSQGATNYVASGAQFGSTSAFKKLAIDLTPLSSATALGDAGLINTAPVKLSALGVTSLTGLKITGKINGYTGPGALAAGLAIYTGAPTSPPTSAAGAPDVIYGNAVTYGVPAPLPLFGAGAAFGWSRKLRRRIGAKQIAA